MFVDTREQQKQTSGQSESLFGTCGGSQLGLICRSCSVHRWTVRAVTQLPPPGRRAGSGISAPPRQLTALPHPSPHHGSCQGTAPVPGPRVSTALQLVTRARSRGCSFEALGTAGKQLWRIHRLEARLLRLPCGPSVRLRQDFHPPPPPPCTSRHSYQLCSQSASASPAQGA